jgi:hypothetical protein
MDHNVKHLLGSRFIRRIGGREIYLSIIIMGKEISWIAKAAEC